MGILSLKKLREKPFILISTLLAICGWATSFGGGCMLKILNGAWWVLFYEFLIIFGHLVIFLSGSISRYRLAMLTFLASSIPLLTIQVDYIIQYNHPHIPRLPSSMYVLGYIILLVVQYSWIIILGSDPESPLGQLGRVNSEEALHEYGFYSENKNWNRNDIENSNLFNTVIGPVDYTEKVQALHTYKASIDDPNELSFEKGEILEVIDRNGNWWQGRKSNGMTGIVPSNYFTTVT